ncbi:MAG: C1 family peptidase [Bacteroidales bacterium]|jgi:bleomycin hydrolase|nr:C1 family peptidase [Bacteroidales bacterium]
MKHKIFVCILATTAVIFVITAATAVAVATTATTAATATTATTATATTTATSATATTATTATTAATTTATAATNTVIDSIYGITDVKILKATSVKDQNKSGTCWSFSAVSFLESELLRKGKGEYDLSDMYPVYDCFLRKADKYVRLHGETYFPFGGASSDVFDVLRSKGLMPESVFTGLNYDRDKHDHSEMNRALKAYLDAIVKGKEITTVWKKAYTAILNTYLGEPPTQFIEDGKTYTPESYAKMLGLNADDYVVLTSYTHHPFYTSYEKDVPDNWNRGMVYNVTLDDITAIAASSIDKGYTFVWGGDVSEKGFSWKKGIAIIADETSEDVKGSDRDKWESMNDREKKDAAYKFEKIVPECEITQEIRQQYYDTWESTDDHGMHIIGTAKDKNGNIYFKVKNSWNTSNPQSGFLYMSIPFFKAKTLDITVHKDIIPNEIKKKMNIK